MKILELLTTVDEVTIELKSTVDGAECFMKAIATNTAYAEIDPKDLTNLTSAIIAQLNYSNIPHVIEGTKIYIKTAEPNGLLRDSKKCFYKISLLALPTALIATLTTMVVNILLGVAEPQLIHFIIPAITSLITMFSMLYLPIVKNYKRVIKKLNEVQIETTN